MKNGYLKVERLAELDPVRAHVHREIADGPRQAFFQDIGVSNPDDGLPGPFNAMVRAPQVGLPLHKLGESLRYRGVLSDLTRELCILRTACFIDSGFEWKSHELIAKRAGAGDALLEDVRAGLVPDCGPEESLAINISDCLLRDRSIPDGFIRNALLHYGEEWLVEIVVLVHYYLLLGSIMRAVGVEEPSGLTQAAQTKLSIGSRDSES